MFNKVLIANRGEIAVRIIRACRVLGVKTVAVYSSADADALHVQLADEAVCIGPAQSAKSYLNQAAIIGAAQITHADAIHPGYGFLSENADFVRACLDNDITFIGPKPECIDSMGNKSAARSTMMAAGVPVVPGTKRGLHTVEEALEEARKIEWPIMIKASSGGGGKGMRVSYSEDDFEEMFKIAQLESVNGFSDDTMYLERCVLNPRHIEVQVIADDYGNVVALGERDCSVQRNHQKMIEESPSPLLAGNDELRQRLMADAVKAAQAVGYNSAGTIEFLMDDQLNYYFMEMNTRIQVEHCVTEMVTGIDLLAEMIRTAAGEKLSFTQDDVSLRGHAIECRINAEQPAKNFMPCPGKITKLHLPGGEGVRVDTCCYGGYTVSPYYDSMIAKVIVHGRDRANAIAKMKAALGELTIEGIESNTAFQLEIMGDETFNAGKADTGFIAAFLER